jgi:ABC-type multidrug transport system fused ATPase/permease subunit
VERIVELLNIEQELPGTRLPPASWAHFGAPITFRDVTVRYAPDLKPALKDITLKFLAGASPPLSAAPAAASPR